jgi:hypothetical protein
MVIVPHKFQENVITQLSDEMVIGGKLIPKGYCNATQMCKLAKKKISHYFENKRSKVYIEALSRSTGIPVDQLIIVNESEGENWERGTWVHFEVAISIATWISVDLEIWANRALRHIIQGDVAPITKEAQETLQNIYNETRGILSIDQRNKFTDSIQKRFYRLNPDAESISPYEFTNPSDQLNRLLTGHTSKYWCERFNCSNSELRNYWGVPQLKRIIEVERVAQALVDNKNFDPMEAINQAVDLFGYGIWSEDELLGTNDPKTRDRNRKRTERKINI